MKTYFHSLPATAASSTVRFVLLTLALACFAFSPLAQAGGIRFLTCQATDDSVVVYNGTTGVFLGVFIPPGSGGLSAPQNLTIGPDGNLYVSSFNNSSVKRYNGKTGAFIDDFIPSGSGGLANPDQLIFRKDGMLYVSSRFLGTISRYDALTGEFVDTFVNDGRLNGFTGFTFGPDGNIYAGEFNFDHDILRFRGKTGKFIGIFNSGNPFLDAAVTGLTFGPDRNLYASRWIANLVERYDGRTGAFIDTFVTPGSGGLNVADYLVFGTHHDLYVASLGSGNILRYDGRTGLFEQIFTAGGPPLLPKGLAFLPQRDF